MLKCLVLCVSCAIVYCNDFAIDSCCKDPYTSSRKFYQEIATNSPYYAIIVPRTTKTEAIDNICYTYFENDHGELLNLVSVVYRNGASEQYFFNIADYTDYDGATLSRSHSCSYLDFLLDETCCENVFILYRCFIGEDLCNNQRVDIGPRDGVDIRLALSKTPRFIYTSEDCAVCLIRSMEEDSQFTIDDFIFLPNQLPPQCVTEYNCRDSFRADSAIGEICINECCRLSPHVNLPLLPEPLIRRYYQFRHF